MPQAIPAVVETIAKIFTKEAVKKIAVAVAINALSRMLQPKSKDTSADRSSRLSKRRDSSPYRDVILGTAVTAGTFIDAIAYSTDNMFYCEIIKLADHECDGLVAAYAGGRQLTINGDGSVQEYIEGSTPRMWIYFQAGAWGETTHSEVLTAFGGRYTSSDRGRGVCRVILKCDMRSDKLFPSRSPPDLTFAVRGAKIYSPRLDTSLGGSHVWGNYATYAWTDNLADIAYNVARGIFVYGGASPERLAGGSYDAEELPLASWAAESSACEVAVPLKAGGTERRYRGGLLFSTNEELEGILADLAAGAAGFMLDLGGTLLFQAGVARTPVATLADSDFIAGKLRRTWRQAARERFNTVTGRFTDPALRYQQNTLPIRRSTADITADNNEERVDTMSLGVVQSQTQGQRVMEIRRRSNRLNTMFQVELPPRWQHLEAGDWITYTSARRGWTKTFVLLPAELKTTPEDMLVSALSMVEVSSSVYTWTPASDELDVTNPVAVGPGSIPDATISGFTAVASANTATNESAPAIEVAWTPPSDPTIDSVAIDYRRPAALGWLTQSFDAALGSGQITGLASGSWQVRARPITTPLRPGTASGIVNITLAAMTSATAGSATIANSLLGQGPWATDQRGTETVFRPGQNLLKNPTGALNSTRYWTRSGSTIAVTAVLLGDGRGWAFFGAFGAGTASGQMFSDDIPMAPNQPLTVSGIIEPFNVTTNNMGISIEAFNASSGYIGSVAFTTNSGAVSASGTTPANTAFVRVYYQPLNSVFGTSGFVVIRQLKLELGSTRTVWTDDAIQAGQSNADVTGTNTAASIVSQGSGATANNLTGLNPTEGAKLGGIEAGATIGARVGTNIFLGSGTTPLPGTQLLNEFVPVGSNSIADNDFQRLTDTGIWTLVSWSGASTSHSRQVGTNNFSQYLAQAFGTPSAGAFIGRYGVGDNRLGVRFGERVQASALVGGFGLVRIHIQIFWWDASGALISSSAKVLTSFPSGGVSPSNYAYDGITIEVPPAIAAASFNVYGETAGGVLNPYLYSAQEMLCKVPPGQTALAPYAPGFRGQPGADVTGGNTAAAFIGQGNQATRNTTAGALASRPTGADGDSYHATDTREMFYKIGGTWVKVADVANTFNVSLSASNITVLGAPGTLTTGSVTATVTGGSGSYSYAWAVITKDVQSLNPFMTSQSATSSCRASLGSGQAVSGTIQLTVTDTSTGAIQIRTLTYSINTNS